jgi:hypothetical protein
VQTVRVLDDGQAGAWVARRLRDHDGGTVDAVVPAGFAAYARLLHPVTDGVSETTWAQAATLMGRRVHALTGWPELAGAGVGAPPVGTLPPEQLAALCDVLAEHTASPAECTFALPAGWPGAAGRTTGAGVVRLSGGEFLLVAGPLDAAVPLCFSDEPGRWWARSPAAFWPQDRAWCVVTAPDRRCTLVGASVGAVEDLLAASELEAWPVRATDRLPAPA